MSRMSVSAFGIDFQNPVMVASGTFGYGDESNSVMPIHELGALVVKTITLEPRKGNPPPRIAEAPAGMLNSIGLANVGIEVFLKEKLQWIIREKGQCRLIVNIGGKNASEFALLAHKLSGREGLDAIEINVSCPNVETGGAAFFAHPEELSKVVRGCREVTDLPLIVKLSPNVTDITHLARIAQDEGADAISLINTVNGMLVDVESRKPLLGTITGGYSGPAILPIGLYQVYRASSAVSIPVIGIGGIRCAEDALQYLLVGASLIQVGTANFINPVAPREVIEGIERYLSRKGIGEIGELVGSIAL
ncbi:MAG: dihydroorotate dehydrogenase [Candidatus Glassbacteria bacterium]